MQFTRRRIADAGLLVLVNAMWAGQYPAYKTATSRAGPVIISLWTFLIASAVLLKEKISAAMLAGGLLTLAGTILITSADKTPAE
ncbi:MAG: hypothetical protein ABSF14_19850 [Terriglobia bacterium]|jgi:drug/metabolite transporter (DMT)-like permease